MKKEKISDVSRDSKVWNKAKAAKNYGYKSSQVGLCDAFLGVEIYKLE